MKLNWGTNIATVYILFVLFIGFMVYKSTGQKYDLVTEDYYAEEIKYQSTIDGKERANNLEKKIYTTIQGKSVRINFSQKERLIEGEIVCFRPSDEEKDFTIKLSTSQNFYDIPLEKFTKGKYIFKISWTVGGVDYYNEQTVIIP